MPFFIIKPTVGDLGQTKQTPMKRTDYNAPTVETLAVKVEAGMQTSGTGTTPNTTQYNADSWDTPTPNNSAPLYT